MSDIVTVLLWRFKALFTRDGGQCSRTFQLGGLPWQRFAFEKGQKSWNIRNLNVKSKSSLQGIVFAHTHTHRRTHTPPHTHTPAHTHTSSHTHTHAHVKKRSRTPGCLLGRCENNVRLEETPSVTCDSDFDETFQRSFYRECFKKEKKH